MGRNSWSSLQPRLSPYFLCTKMSTSCRINHFDHTMKLLYSTVASDLVNQQMFCLQDVMQVSAVCNYLTLTYGVVYFLPKSFSLFQILYLYQLIFIPALIDVYIHVSMSECPCLHIVSISFDLLQIKTFKQRVQGRPGQTADLQMHKYFSDHLQQHHPLKLICNAVASKTRHLRAVFLLMNWAIC